MALSPGDVEAAFKRLFIVPAAAAPATTRGDAPVLGLRVEDLKKTREVLALLEELEKIGRRKLVVDAAAGHGYVGILAAELMGKIDRLVAIERNPDRARRISDAGMRVSTKVAVDARAEAVDDPRAWPDDPDVVVALHACGAAADAVMRRAAASRARWILVVPCCYANTLEQAPRARAHADAIGLPPHAEVRRRIVEAFVDGERVLTLEAAGYEVALVPFVAKAVTPHNLLFRARRVLEPVRMEAARARLAKLSNGPAL